MAAPYTTKTVAMFFLANINQDYFAIKFLIFHSIKKANNLRQQSEPSIQGVRSIRFVSESDFGLCVPFSELTSSIQHVFIQCDRRHKLNLKTV